MKRRNRDGRGISDHAYLSDRTAASVEKWASFAGHLIKICQTSFNVSTGLSANLSLAHVLNGQQYGGDLRQMMAVDLDAGCCCSPRLALRPPMTSRLAG